MSKYCHWFGWGLRKSAPLISIRSALFGVLLLGVAGCDSLEGKMALGVTALTAYGAQTPVHEVQQTYYLGVFDPQSQVDPTVYRVRLHGQASAINTVNFRSGWLPSMAVDSLGTTVKWDETSGQIKIVPRDQDGGASGAGFKTGRRLVAFGPEGFRESPGNERLVVYMGSSPEEYFNAVNEAFSTVASATQPTQADPDTTKFNQDIIGILNQVSVERQHLDALNLERTVALPKDE